MENTTTGLTYQKVLEFDSSKPSLEDVYKNHSNLMTFINFGKGSSKALKNLNQYILAEIPLSFLMDGSLDVYLQTRRAFKYDMNYDTIILMFDPVTLEYKKLMRSYKGYVFSIEKEKKGMKLLEKLNQSKIQSQEEFLSSLNL